MNSFLRNFVKRGLLEAIGHEPDYWIMITASNWYDKGVLLEEDLIEIQSAIDEHNRQPEPEEVEQYEDVE